MKKQGNGTRSLLFILGLAVLIAGAAVFAFKKRAHLSIGDPLTLCTVYRIHDNRPVFVKTTLDGNVAFYGLILQSTGNEKIAEYLLSKSLGGLWEYHDGYGVTSADSAFVIEGLLSAGYEGMARRSLEIIVNKYYSREKGTFLALRPHEGGAPYWSLPAVETAAHIAYLLYIAFGGRRYREQILSTAKFVAKNQQSDGGWQSTWFPSRTLPVFYAVRLLRLFREQYVDNLARAENYLLRMQNKDGSWNERFIETAAALRALNVLGASHINAYEKGVQWLHDHLNDAKGKGEPVLFYGIKRKKQVFFVHCSDTGLVTKAWITLALKGK